VILLAVKTTTDRTNLPVVVLNPISHEFKSSDEWCAHPPTHPCTDAYIHTYTPAYMHTYTSGRDTEAFIKQWRVGKD
jgi:hypothetical protein